MITAIVTKLLLSGSTLSLLLTLAARFLPDNTVMNLGRKIGKATASLAATKLGKYPVAGILSFLEHSIGCFVIGFADGLQEPASTPAPVIAPPPPPAPPAA